MTHFIFIDFLPNYGYAINPLLISKIPAFAGMTKTKSG